MDTIFLGLSENENRKLVETLNESGSYIVCDLSWTNYSSKSSDISYFTFCSLGLEEAFNSLGKSPQSGLIISNLGFSFLEDHKFELMYIFSMVLPLDPIFVSGKNTIESLEGKCGIKVRRFVEFNPKSNFMVDLKRGLEELENCGSDLSKIVSMFNAQGTILSFGNSFKEVVKLKTASGQHISYEEFLHEILSRSYGISDILSTVFIREYNPVDLFVQKSFKSKKADK